MDTARCHAVPPIGAVSAPLPPEIDGISRGRKKKREKKRDNLESGAALPIPIRRPRAISSPRNRWGLGISGLEWLGRAKKQGSPAASTELKLSRGKEMEEINKGFGVSHLVADDADGGRGRAITPKPAIRIHLTPKSWALRHYARDSCLIPSDDGEISGPTIRRLGVAKRVAVSHGIKWTVESYGT
ncbi:hypothetical protein B296_00008699 [Ensete ventricosum]|uniref:Uncharacterized protein n=1 Tax=Ensete ventricosum TaxID=4639 RepID=A0A427AZL8_ENSVE|nr:hypothetical protein B296_00008699 [Ensete ventricosum]